MGKNLNISMLLDFYGQMLTDKQTDAVDLYYNQDFSLSEIAEQLSISRQGARDLIKRAEKQLLDFEEALGLVKRFSEIDKKLKIIKSSCSDIKEKTGDDLILSDIEKINSLIDEITNEI